MKTNDAIEAIEESASSGEVAVVLWHDQREREELVDELDAEADDDDGDTWWGVTRRGTWRVRLARA